MDAIATRVRVSSILSAIRGTRLKDLVVVAGAMVFVSTSVVAKAVGSPVTESSSPLELISSVMWQPLTEAKRYVYPPGVPAVLKTSTIERTFRIEQYFSGEVDPAQLVPRVHGTWPETLGNEFRFDPSRNLWSNPYLNYNRPVCAPKQTEFGFRFRCIMDLALARTTPSGIVGISLALKHGNEEITHPNSVFWVIIPEEVQRAPEIGPVADHSEVLAKHGFSAYLGHPILEENNEAVDVSKYVVRISMGGNFMLGSGYLARNVAAILHLFPQRTADAIRRLPSNSLFVVTAAHLFPVSYGQAPISDVFLNPVDRIRRPLQSAQTFDLDVNGVRVPKAGDLVGRNVESDVALLFIPDSSMAAVTSAMGVGRADEILGLEIASTLKSETRIRVIGFPASLNGRKVERE